MSEETLEFICWYSGMNKEQIESAFARWKKEQLPFLHKGMIMQTKNGNVAHVLADPNMSKETESAIEKMIDLAYNLDFEEKKEDEKIPCYACQGGGCPVCSGYGYYYN